MHKKLQRYQWHIAIAIFVVSAVFFSLRLLMLLPLYIDADLRSRVEARVRGIADERGWLLSNLSLAAVARGEFKLCHREHWRGRDFIDCETFPLEKP